MLELIGAAIVAIIGALLLGRRQGRKAAQQQAKGQDHERATEIEDAADRARRSDDGGADPLERLREAGRIRD